jgi:ribosome recycling factor
MGSKTVIRSMVPKLTTEQRQWCQQVLRAKMEDLLEAFEGH